jgi:hypothetical protein
MRGGKPLKMPPMLPSTSSARIADITIEITIHLIVILPERCENEVSRCPNELEK